MRLKFCGLLVAGDRFVVGAGQAHRRDRRRLRLDREVGEDVAHQRLVDQHRLPKAERWEAWWIAWATPTRIPVAPPRTQSRRVWLTISMIVRTPAPSSPTSQAEARVELDLAGGVGAVAELVLQPLQAEAVALAVRRPAREEEAGDAAVGLGEDEEGVAHRRRA